MFVVVEVEEVGLQSSQKPLSMFSSSKYFRTPLPQNKVIPSSNLKFPSFFAQTRTKTPLATLAKSFVAGFMWGIHNAYT